MSGASIGASAPRRGPSIIDRRAEDRWVGAPVRNASLAMSGVVLASLAIHAGILLFAATFADPQRPPQPTETTVELVQDPTPTAKAPDADKEAAGKSGAAKAPESKAAEVPKAEEPKPELAMPETAKPEAAGPEPAKPEPAKPETAKAEAKTSEPPQPEPPKVADTQQAPREADDPKTAEKEAALESLKQELASLKAEQETLRAENARAAAETQATDQVTRADKAAGAMIAEGIGPIPSSFSGIQLPQLSDIDGEATSYQAVVFSQLAKTKGIRRHMGMLGTAGIVFSIDAAGKLVNATIAQPSGSAALDDEAMQIVTASSPFPKPPPGASRTISANFNFISQPAP